MPHDLNPYDLDRSFRVQELVRWNHGRTLDDHFPSDTGGFQFSTSMMIPRSVPALLRFLQLDPALPFWKSGHRQGGGFAALAGTRRERGGGTV